MRRVSSKHGLMGTRLALRRSSDDGATPTSPAHNQQNLKLVSGVQSNHGLSITGDILSVFEDDEAAWQVWGGGSSQSASLYEFGGDCPTVQLRPSALFVLC